MALRHLFGQPNHQSSSQPDLAARPASADSAGNDETATVRRIVARLEALPVAQRRFVAGFAYVLGRVANADLDISEDEVRLMEQNVMEVGNLPEPQAVLVVEIARNQAELYGGTEDYLVTREFARDATPEERERLLRCCFAVGAADRTITAAETAELDEIGQELGFTDAELRPIRAEYRDSMAAIQQMRRLPGAQ